MASDPKWPEERREPLRPFLKWAGGKRSLIPQFARYLPETFGRYHEPFVGSAALFFHLRPAKAALSDNNERLVRAYRGLRDDPDRVIALLSSYRYEKDFYYRMRERAIDEEGDAEVAAWLIYLNRTGFNGLYRVNRKNEFNVPFGKYKSPRICNEPRLRACAAQLEGAALEVADFEASVKGAKAGDLVYFDPPYVPLSKTSSFTAYSHKRFGAEEQERLRDVARRLARRGVHVLVSNSSAPEVRRLYADGFDLFEIQARRSINNRADRRGPITELLIRGRVR